MREEDKRSLLQTIIIFFIAFVVCLLLFKLL